MRRLITSITIYNTLYGQQLPTLRLSRAFDLADLAEIRRTPSTPPFLRIDLHDQGTHLWNLAGPVEADRAALAGTLAREIPAGQRRPLPDDPYLTLPAAARHVLDGEGAAYFLPAGRGTLLRLHRTVAAALVHSLSRREAPPACLRGVEGDLVQYLIDGPGRGTAPCQAIARTADRLQDAVLDGRVEFLRSPATGYLETVFRPAQDPKTSLPLERAPALAATLAPLLLLARQRLQPGDWLIVEDPEEHLPPESLGALAEAFTAFAASGLGVILDSRRPALSQALWDILPAAGVDPLDVLVLDLRGG